MNSGNACPVKRLCVQNRMLKVRVEYNSRRREAGAEGPSRGRQRYISELRQLSELIGLPIPLRICTLRRTFGSFYLASTLPVL